jgi:hypothetical protein
MHNQHLTGENMQTVIDELKKQGHPTHANLELLINAVAGLVAEMDRTGHYVGLDVVSELLDDAAVAMDAAYLFEGEE